MNDIRDQAVKTPSSSWSDDDLRVLIGNHWKSDKTLLQFTRALVDAVEAEAHQIERDRLWVNIVEMSDNRTPGKEL